MLKNLLLFSLVLFLATTASAWAAVPDGNWASVPNASKVSYKIVHKFHEVEGVSTQVEGRAVVTGGQVQIQVRIPVSSFNSGNANRDSNALSVVDGEHTPYVMLKGEGKVCDPAAANCTFVLHSQLSFHGVAIPYDVNVDVTPGESGRMNAHFVLPVTLTKHAIELPSLLFIPIDDFMKVEGTIVMEHKS